MSCSFCNLANTKKIIMIKKILLSISMLCVININAQIADCSELFISEYVEGSGNNKALEIFNPTSSTIDLSSYIVIRYSNGSNSATSLYAIQLVGSILPNDVHVGVLEKLNPAGTGNEVPVAVDLQAKADVFYSPDYNINKTWYWNGNDAIVLAKGSVNDISNAITVDVFGKIGEDPASGAWTADAASGFTLGAWWTKDHTLKRKSTIFSGDINPGDNFNPSLEWDSLAEDTWTNLGSHTCNCPSISAVNDAKEVPYTVYPNPANAGEQITINSSANIESIDVLNILGANVLIEKSNTINTTKLPKGTYIIMIKFSDGREVNNKIVIE